MERGKKKHEGKKSQITCKSKKSPQNELKMKYHQCGIQNASVSLLYIQKNKKNSKYSLANIMVGVFILILW